MLLENSNVLVVEDNAQTTRLIRMMLQDMHEANIVTSKDVIEAQEILDDAEVPVDVILCDWRMPRMTGIEFLK